MENSNLTLIKNNSIVSEFDGINVEKMDIFCYYKDKKNIGYSLINKNGLNIDNFYIKIFNQYQGNGYGNLLFIETLNILKSRGFKDLTINIHLSNYKMINIILKNGGIEVTNLNGIKKFIIKL